MVSGESRSGDKMPLKNKYAVLRVGIECNYHDAERKSEIDEVNPDFLVTKLFKGGQKKSSDNLPNNGKCLPCFKTVKEYEVEPLFGDKVDDVDIWKENIYGAISEWIDTDNRDEGFSAYCVDALNKEMQWSSYISLSNLIVNPPSYEKCDNYGRCINGNIKSYNGISIIMKVPLAKRIEHLNVSGKEKGTVHCHSTKFSKNSHETVVNGWNLWAKFISYCNFDFSNLSVGIELVNVKDIDIHDINLDIWKSEPVKLIIIPLDAFAIDSKSGYPFLPKRLKNLVIFFFRKNIEVVLTDGRDRTLCSLGGVEAENTEIAKNVVDVQLTQMGHVSRRFHSHVSYLKCCIYYIKRLFMSIENFDNENLFDSEYWDYLQLPLQPLKDNLPSQTYEIFERDQTKYYQYEVAISRYFEDRLRGESIRAASTNGANVAIDTHATCAMWTIFVVGAGRGPLVDCTLRALEKNKITKFEIYAIEKNDGAILVLRNRLLDRKWENVRVIHSDMRYIQMDKKADLIVSELLGSFGDNELFPECLDGIQRYLKEDGVSIPENCLSYIEPISCSELYYKIGNNNFPGNKENFYIVNIYSYCKISDDGPKECFYFNVPNKNIKNNNCHNNRYKNLNFQIKMDSYLHGFLCYFKSKLYDDVYISIEPSTHTKNMHSWYPLFMPINRILFLKHGQKMSISLWRLSDTHKIWYEWCINEPIATAIHNFNARHFSIGM
ncbi:protein arginine N-methyltransferase 5, putative [Plasmodium ovale]|uniref:Protein arginine N-methyltransferase n=2 Tax=Plasmodium ovale TaxID=36330 RepID=A0A1A8VWP6_PLAOA|nr:arginine N-methyltransferase 5 [Plasmodium ovale curtisi]SBS93639.1 arginine N-methyltransferase 5 [Plasmodium ovale curtisi]SCP04895.1 protein arginine N-methyltransferase 5, putative [Plasmodium ovale]